MFGRRILIGRLKGQSSELGETCYRISLSYRGKYPSRLVFSGKANSNGYNCNFDAFVWAHNYDEAVERAKTKWTEREKAYERKGIRGRVLVRREGMWNNPD